MPNSIQLVGDQKLETTDSLQQREKAVVEAYRGVMQEGVHYGVIPHTSGKPSLLKAGAEMLCTLFRLVPSYVVTRTDLDGGHREYEVSCKLTKLDTGQVWSEGVGLCTTLESKYRYRWKNKERVENPDIADVYNTVLKMAKKRALVDATLTATGCSSMFTQDVEDFSSPVEVEAEVQEENATKEQVDMFNQLVSELAKARGTDEQKVTTSVLKSNAVTSLGFNGTMTRRITSAAIGQLRAWLNVAQQNAQEASSDDSKAQEQEQGEVVEPDLADADIDF